ncbi:unnamed protein product [Symbiodinium natans]|uniref:Uncharacterized protein n=1 Tax=Symbiodinium natans TaxID=878477 RepID=A0A812QMK8_9DINO|nr:unnamed protein product [Symbiodinium natans]
MELPKLACSARAATVTRCPLGPLATGNPWFGGLDVGGVRNAWQATMLASMVLGSALIRRKSRRPKSVGAAFGLSKTSKNRREGLFNVVATLAAAPSPAVAKGGGNPFLLVQEGEEAFKKNKVEESVELFDKAAQSGYPKARLWQRGLSLYYAKDFQSGSEQFRKDVEMNPNDTEESIWAFLCEAQLLGFQQARRQILTVGVDPRPVMRTAMALFRGDDDAKSIAALEDLSAGGRSDVFYSCLYLGLFYEAKGDTENARRYLLKATSCKYGATSTDYMADLARVHVARRGWAEVEF